MPAGKLAAQATHAARISLLKYISQHPEHLEEFISLGSCGSVVVLQAKNLSQLEDCHAKALSENFPTALFTDSEHILLPHFDGSPVVTALSIGPAPRQTMRHLTKKFRCVQ